MYTDATLISNETLLKFCHIGIVGVVIMIVAIPEGLPLSVSLAMSFSVEKLKDRNILIKNIEALQKMAMCHEISISKTGCLTTGEMTVAQYQLLDQTNVTPHYENDSTFIDRYELNKDIKELLFECIYSNTDVRIEENDYSMMYEPSGQEIEVALVKFLVDN
jgi:magnesium-transporting ATPase (P-type)